MKYSRFTALLTIFLLIATSSLANATTVRTISVDALSSSMLSFNLDTGHKFSGSLSISGGADDIDFWVTNPVGAAILNLGRISHGASFEFTANNDGAYTLHFGNAWYWWSGKIVTLSYDITTPLMFGIDPFFIGIAVVVVGLGLAFVLVFFAYKHGRETAQKNKANAPATNVN